MALPKKSALHPCTMGNTDWTQNGYINEEVMNLREGWERELEWGERRDMMKIHYAHEWNSKKEGINPHSSSHNGWPVSVDFGGKIHFLTTHGWGFPWAAWAPQRHAASPMVNASQREQIKAWCFVRPSLQGCTLHIYNILLIVWVSHDSVWEQRTQGHK